MLQTSLMVHIGHGWLLDFMAFSDWCPKWNHLAGYLPMNSEANNTFVAAQDIKGAPLVWTVVLNAQELAILTYQLPWWRIMDWDGIVVGKITDYMWTCWVNKNKQKNGRIFVSVTCFWRGLCSVTLRTGYGTHISKTIPTVKRNVMEWHL